MLYFVFTVKLKLQGKLQYETIKVERNFKLPDKFYLHVNCEWNMSKLKSKNGLVWNFKTFIFIRWIIQKYIIQILSVYSTLSLWKRYDLMNNCTMHSSSSTYTFVNVTCFTLKGTLRHLSLLLYPALRYHVVT